MKKIICVVLSFFPSFIHVFIRRMLGQEIGKGSKIMIGTIILSENIEIGVKTKIGPFSFIKAKELKIRNNVSIKPLVIINTLKVKIDDYVHLAPLTIINSGYTKKSYLEIGEHSRVFPFCWIDTGEGVKIGKHVGVGGHTLMFTHGVWSNYVDGGPISYGPIELKDNVWLPWRIFILPNVTIGKNVIVGANSLINKSVEDNSLVGGSPARVIKKMDFDTTIEEKIERFNEILVNFMFHIEFKYDQKSTISAKRLEFDSFSIIINEINNVGEKDLLILFDSDSKTGYDYANKEFSVLKYSELAIYLQGKENKIIKEFISYIRRYGIRLSVK